MAEYFQVFSLQTIKEREGRQRQGRWARVTNTVPRCAELLTLWVGKVSARQGPSGLSAFLKTKDNVPFKRYVGYFMGVLNKWVRMYEYKCHGITIYSVDLTPLSGVVL